MADAKWAPLHPGDPEEEARMRAALERFGSASGAPHTIRAPNTMRRRPFAKDGEVEVERRPIVDGGANRLEEALSALRTERDARMKVEIALEEAKAANDKLQTEAAHMEISLREVQEARTAAEAALEEQRGREVVAQPQDAPEAAVAPVQRRKPGRPRKGQEKPKPLVVEQEPIWDERWLKR